MSKQRANSGVGGPGAATISKRLTGRSITGWTSRGASTAPSGSKDEVIGRPSLWIAEDFWVLRFRLMVKRGPWLRPQASEGEAQHGPFCWIGRIGQGDQHLHCG